MSVFVYARFLRETCRNAINKDRNNFDTQMAEIAYIFNGYRVGDTDTEVYCNMPSGTTIYLYQKETLLGTGVLGTNKRCLINHVPIQDTGYSLEAYPTERLGFSQRVEGSNVKMTGWLIPNEVNYNGTIFTYEQWKALAISNPEQYRDIADLFNPSLSINNNPDRDSLLNLAKGKLIFSSDVNISSETGRAVVTVKSILNAYGGYTVQFDDGAIGSSLSKIYDTSGNYKVKVVDLDNADNYLEESFSITIPNANVAPPTTIGQLYYTPTYAPENPTAGQANAVCVNQLQFKLEGAIPSGWVDSEGGDNNRWYRIFDNVASGTNLIEARVKNNIADYKSQEFIQ